MCYMNIYMFKYETSCWVREGNRLALPAESPICSMGYSITLNVKGKR
jgi:hypothetical protein